jgi:hypothetical protein
MADFQEREIPLANEAVSTPVEYVSFNSGTDLQRVLSSKQVAHWLKLTEVEVERMAAAGEIPARQVSGGWRFGAVAVNRWIEALPVTPARIPEPVIEKLEDIAEQWRELSSTLGTALEPIIGTSVDIASEGGFSFSGQLVTSAQLEKAYILHVLARQDGNKSAAAHVLGIDPATLYRKLKEF